YNHPMEYGRFLGIDESNHGRFPEIFAGIYSDSERDLKKGEYSKLRHRKGTIAGKIRENNAPREYRHVVIPQEYTKLFSKNQLGLIAMSELIKHGGSDLEQVIIDGEKNLDDISKLKELVHPSAPKVLFVPKGDKTYRLVNLADFTAYRLFKEYTGHTTEKDLEERFADFIVTPRIEDYVTFFDQDKRIY
ncbi:MAG: hypothetical protein ACOC32_05310, partial [Nanoarchaeota archaeon]